jgi:hypothetical protein
MGASWVLPSVTSSTGHSVHPEVLGLPTKGDGNYKVQCSKLGNISFCMVLKSCSLLIKWSEYLSDINSISRPFKSSHSIYQGA